MKKTKKTKKTISGNVQFKKPEGLKNKIFNKLYSNQAEGLYTLVCYFPFFSTSWIAGGLVLDKIIPFFLVTSIIVFCNYAKIILLEKNIVFKREFALVTAAVVVASILAFYHFTSLEKASAYLALTVLMFFLEAQLKNSSPFVIILKNISLIFRMSLYSLIGIASQRLASDDVLQYAVFGFVPGTILAASNLTKYTQVFLNHAWKRQIIDENKKGEKIIKPGSIARLISVFAVVGPAIPILLTPFDVFPTPFLVTALVFSLIIKNLEAYLHTSKPDSELALGLANISLLMSFALLFIGLIIRMGVI